MDEVKERIMRISIAALATLASLGLGATAPAMATALRSAEQPGVSQKVVHFGDLNLNTEHGADQLYRRLNFAARDVCSDNGDMYYLTQSRAYHQCRRNALERAVAQLDEPKVTAIYDGHFPSNPIEGRTPGRGARSVG
jgi:UrcA family protein